MKLLSIYCLILLFGCSYAQSPKPLKVYWTIGDMNNDSLKDLPEKILKAIHENKIQAYDDSRNVLKRSDVELKITPKMVESYTKEDIEMMLLNEDYSAMNEIITTYTAEQLNKMLSEGKSIDKLITIKHRKYYECNRLIFGLYETLMLDTTSQNQRGTIQYVRLLIPGYYTSSKKTELLCMLQYDDVKKLNTVKKELELIENRRFVISTWDSDICIIDASGSMECLSDLIPSGKRMPEKGSIDHSIFLYFKKSIYVFNPTAR